MSTSSKAIIKGYEAVSLMEVYTSGRRRVVNGGYGFT